jgi:diguanylate cyclase (GGDEF)-like protein/PAS domain S-box-containing protein
MSSTSYSEESVDFAAKDSVTVQRSAISSSSLQPNPLPYEKADGGDLTRLILEAAGDGIYGLDTNGFVTFLNPAAQAMTGWSAEDLAERTQHSMVHHSHPDGSHYPREECPIYAALHDGQVHHREDEVFWRKDGSCFPVSYTSTPILNDGQITGAVVIFRDISERVRKERWDADKSKILASMIALEPLSTTLELLAEGLARYWSGCNLAIHLRSGDRLYLKASFGLSVPLLTEWRVLPMREAGSLISHAARRGKEMTGPIETEALDDVQWVLPLLTGSREALGTLTVLCPKGLTENHEARSFFQRASDLTRLAVEHSRMHGELTFRAQHDALTGLPNRMLLEQHLEQAIERAVDNETLLGICYIDLDGFKQINDTLGHAVGDEYLKIISKTLQGACRNVDTLARQGGDEFILLLPDLATAREARTIAERVLQSLRTPFQIGDATLSAAASAGISIYPDDGNTSAILLQNADTALYAAKRDGRNRIQSFTAELGTQVRQNARIHDGLRNALERNQFQLAYQPLFNATRELQGFEALLRWQHPEDGIIPPDHFIGVAEETGLIVPIGAWVLHEACRQCVTWQKTFGEEIRIFVNVSAVQINRDDFVDTVNDALHSTGLAPRHLEIEVTETWIISDREAAAVRLQTLREIGIRISIDDFGTGQSSFGCLHTLPIDTLKIDRSFVSRLDGTAKQLSTVRAIITLAEQLGLRTVAEGVETEGQFKDLLDLGCSFLQGFLLARPLSVDAASALVKEKSAKRRP